MLTACLLAAAVLAGVTGAWSPCGLSMVETLSPAGFAGRLRTSLLACVTFATGALLGGAVTFGGLALVGAMLGAGGQAAMGMAAVIAMAAAAGEARGLRIVPQVRRQVPEAWRRVLPVPVAATGYGVLLGLGFTTFVLSYAVWALAGISVALGDPLIGLLVGLAFGAGRALPVVLLAPAHAGAATAAMCERPAILRGLRRADAAAMAACALALALAPPVGGGDEVMAAGGGDEDLARTVGGGNEVAARGGDEIVARGGDEVVAVGGGDEGLARAVAGGNEVVARTAAGGNEVVARAMGGGGGLASRARAGRRGLGARAPAAQVVALELFAGAAYDPSAAGDLVAWQRPGGVALLARPDATVGLPGSHPALAPGRVAWLAGDQLQVADPSTLRPLAAFDAPGAGAIAVSETWVAWRVRDARGGEQLLARAIADAGAGSAERVAGTRAPAELGRPVLSGDLLLYHHAGPRRAGRIMAVDLASGRRQVLRRETGAMLSNPATDGTRLLYVRATGRTQELRLGALLPDPTEADDAVLVTPSPGQRDQGYEPGLRPHRRELLPPLAKAGVNDTLWTTALTAAHAYVTRLRTSSRAPRTADILRVGVLPPG